MPEMGDETPLSIPEQSHPTTFILVSPAIAFTRVSITGRLAPWTCRFNRIEIDCWSCWIRRIWIAFDPTSNRRFLTIANRYTKQTRLFLLSIFRLMVFRHLLTRWPMAPRLRSAQSATNGSRAFLHLFV